jgi:hypothetical protein
MGHCAVPCLSIAREALSFCKRLDLVKGVLHQGAELARRQQQVDVVDRANRGVRVRHRDFDAASLMLLNNHVAEQNRTNALVGTNCALSQWQAAGTENDVGTQFGREMFFQGMTQVYLG